MTTEAKSSPAQDRPEPGACGVWGPDDGESYWLPQPSGGYMTIKVAPDTFGANLYMAAVQVIDEGGVLTEHNHTQNDEMLFVWEGEGSAYVDGVRHRVEPGSLVFVGRHRKHLFVNEGKGPLKLFFMITPGGLETLIRSVGRPREAGEAAPARFERAADELAGHETIKYTPDGAAPGARS